MVIEPAAEERQLVVSTHFDLDELRTKNKEELAHVESVAAVQLNLMAAARDREKEQLAAAREREREQLEHARVASEQSIALRDAEADRELERLEKLHHGKREFDPNYKENCIETDLRLAAAENKRKTEAAELDRAIKAEDAALALKIKTDADNAAAAAAETALKLKAEAAAQELKIKEDNDKAMRRERNRENARRRAEIRRQAGPQASAIKNAQQKNGDCKQALAVLTAAYTAMKTAQCRDALRPLLHNAIMADSPLISDAECCKLIEDITAPIIAVTAAASKSLKEGIYVLELDTPLSGTGIRFYVGESVDIDRRLKQHAGIIGGGASCVNGAGPFERIELMLPDGASAFPHVVDWERNEVLLRMYTFGIHAVRGWIFKKCVMSEHQWHCAFDEICEKPLWNSKKLCAKCGSDDGHFAMNCDATHYAAWTTATGSRYGLPLKRITYYK
jgi:hypothetical protein